MVVDASPLSPKDTSKMLENDKVDDYQPARVSDLKKLETPKDSFVHEEMKGKLTIQAPLLENSRQVA